MKLRKISCRLGTTGLLFSVVALTACGKDRATSSTDSADALAADTLSEVTNSVADDTSTASSLMIEDYRPQSLTVTRTCTASGGAATVVITASGSDTQTLTRSKASVSSSITETGTTTRVWTPPTGGSVACNVAGTRAQIPWGTSTAINGLSVLETVDRSRTAVRTVTVTATSKSTTITNNFSAKGNRAVVWSTPSTTPASGTVIREKSISSAMARTASITTASGASLDLATSVTIPAATPLVVDVVRSTTAPFALQTKTIKSGTVVNTRSGTDRTESTFADVVHDFSSTNTSSGTGTPCLPTSGTVTVKYFSPDTATTASSTYTIKFGASTDSGVSITPEGGTEADYPTYDPKGCDLEKEI